MAHGNNEECDEEYLDNLRKNIDAAFTFAKEKEHPGIAALVIGVDARLKQGDKSAAAIASLNLHSGDVANMLLNISTSPEGKHSVWGKAIRFLISNAKDIKRIAAEKGIDDCFDEGGIDGEDEGPELKGLWIPE